MTDIGFHSDRLDPCMDPGGSCVPDGRWILAGSGLNGGACSAGGRYRAGEGVPQDYLKALRWVRKLAELGNVGQKEYKQLWH